MAELHAPECSRPLLGSLTYNVTTHVMFDIQNDACTIMPEIYN